MALPKNSHHVHSDGYRSEKGEQPPAERYAEEVLDEVENRCHPGNIGDARIEFDTEIVVEIRDVRAFETVEDIALDMGCQMEYDIGEPDEASLPFEFRLLVDY